MSAIVPNIVQATSCQHDDADVIVEPAFQAVTQTVTIETDAGEEWGFDGPEFVNEVEVSSQEEMEEDEESAWIPPEVRVTVAERLPQLPTPLQPSTHCEEYFESFNDFTGLLDL